MGAVTTAYELDYHSLRDGLSAEMRAEVVSTVPIFGDCAFLRSDLGVRDLDPLLLWVVPLADGPCGSSDCPGRLRCPLHPSGKQVWDSEKLQRHFQAQLRARYCGNGGTVLGRSAQWADFRNWYAMEMGEDGWEWTEEETLRWLSSVPLLRLLLRATKRGASVGFGGGGSGEGVLGWLAPDETLLLVSRLEPYPLGAGEPIPSGLAQADMFLASDYLPSMRGVLETLLQLARLATSRERGLALIRS